MKESEEMAKDNVNPKRKDFHIKKTQIILF